VKRSRPVRFSAAACAVALGLLAAMAPAPGSAQGTGVAGTLAQVNRALQAGEADKALGLIGSLPQAGAQMAEARNFKCRVRYALQQWNAAVDECEEAVRLDGQNANNHLWLGRALGEKADRASFMTAYSLGKRVRSEFETAVNLDPRNAEALSTLGEFYKDAPGVVGGGIDKAEGIAAQLDKVDPARAHQLRAGIAEARKDLGAAEREFKQAIATAQNNIPARLAQTQVALVRQDFDAALIDADAVLKISPNSVQGTVMKAEALQRLHRSDEARGLLTKVLEKNPKQVESLLELGLLDLNEKKVKDGEDLFKRAWEADPNNLRGLMGESRAYLMDGQPDKSVQVVEAEAQKYPKRLDLQSLLGNSEVSSGQVDKAIGTFQSLMPKVSDPRQQSDLWNRIGEAWLRKGDYQQSINSIEKARQGQPQNVNLMIELAMLYEAQNKKDVSRKYYEQSLKIDPTNALALNNLAYLIAETTGGDLDQALTYATKAKQRLPNHPEINDTLGWIYLKKNLTDNAVDTFRTLVTQAPQSSTYHYHYAMALMQKGDLVTAKKECESALADKPKKEEENQIHQLMTKLG